MKNVKKMLFTASAMTLLAACSPGPDKPAEEEQVIEDAPVEDQQEKKKVEPKEKAEMEHVDIEDMYRTDFPISLDAALQIFADQYGDDVTIESVEFEEENETYTYEVKGFSKDREYAMKVDAYSGEVLKDEVEKEDDTISDDALDLKDILSPKEAMAKALEQSSGNYVKSWSLEMEDGQTVYELDMEGSDDIEIDAKTGKFLDL